MLLLLNVMEYDILEIYTITNQFSIIKIIFMTPTKILIALFIIQMISNQITLDTSTGIYIDKATLSSDNQPSIYYTSFNPPLTPMTNSSATIFQVGWRYTLSNVIYSGMGIQFFAFGTANTFLSYKVEFKNVSIYGAQIQLQCYETSSSFSYVTFGIVIITQNNNYLELITYENFCDFTFSAGTQNFNTASSKFYFTPTTVVNLFIQIQWTACTTLLDPWQYLMICPSTIDSSNLVNILVNSGLRLYVNFKVNVLLINPVLFQPSSVIFLYSTSPGAIPPNFDVPAQFGSPLFSNTCLLGLYYFYLTLSYSSYLYPDLNGTTINAFQHNLNYFAFNGICLGMCPVSYIYNVTSSTCQRCRDHILNCYSCSSMNQCTQCFPSAYLGSGACILCRQSMYNCKTCINHTNCTACFTGDLVDGGCTDVVGCIQVTQYIQIDISKTKCIKCGDQFILDVWNQICVCKVGWRVGSYCTTMYGCIALQKNVSGIDCLFCNTTVLFQRDPITHQCQCITGFYFNRGHCSEICGDGLLFTLQCDDGNLIDGDGCSHTCEIEIFYQCSKSSPSVCQFYGLIIGITLTNIQKVADHNQGIFTFSFNPKLRGLDRMNISKYFYFSCSASLYKVLKWVYSDGTASVYVDYQQRLQGKSATVNFTFDQFYVHHSQVSIDFSMISHGSKLLFYSRQNQQLINMGYILLGASLLAIFILLFGSWFHRMVGVELVQTLQIVYYLQFVIYDYSQADSIYQQMSLVGLNNYFSNPNSINLAINKQFQILSFAFSSTELLLLFLLIIVIFCALSMIVIALYHSNNPSIRSFCFIVSCKLLSNILFPIILSILFPLFLIILSLQQNQYPVLESLLSVKLRAILIFVLIAVYSIVFHKLGFEVKYSKSKLEKNMFKRAKFQYVLLFKCISLTIMMNIIALLRFGLPVILYSLLFCYILIFVWQIVKRPYENAFDNFGITLNSGLIITFIAYVCLRKFQYISGDQTGNAILNLIIICWIALCSVISLVRIIKVVIKTVKNSCQNKIERLTNIQSRDAIITTSKSKDGIITPINERLKEGQNVRNKRNLILENYIKDREKLLVQDKIQAKQQQRQQLKPIIQKYKQMFRKKQQNNQIKMLVIQ